MSSLTPEYESSKIRSISEALTQTPVDLRYLRSLAISKGGLINSYLRSKAWPILLGITMNELSTANPDSLLVGHKDSDQVKRDVERSLWKLYSGSDASRLEKRKELSCIINAILCSHPELNYFQGYHDIASVFLLVSGKEKSFVLLKKTSLYFFRDHLNDSLEVIMKQLDQMVPFLALIDPEIYNFITDCQLQPYFALSWILTWFSHSVDDLSTISRIFDFLLVSHPYTSVYMSIAAILHKKSGLLKCPKEYSAVHSYLSKLPIEEIPTEELISKTLQLLKKFPPVVLERMVLPKVKVNIPKFPTNWKFFTDTHFSEEKGTFKLGLMLSLSRKWKNIDYNKAFGILVLSVMFVVATKWFWFDKQR